ncbi:MAG: type II toxin-antitoxin system Phd/YefM family antitoxin, partial [Terriglobales bacterium]
MATKVTVGARELKNRLGKYLSQVRQGATLVITERGEPVAELRPLAKPSDPDEAAWERLYAEGTVTRGTGKLGPPQP